MPFNKYDEKRLKNIKENVEKMELLGVRPVKSLLDKLSTRKKNAYCIVPSKKTNTEDSESDYEPIDDGQTESEEKERSAPRVQGSANTHGNIQQRSVGGVQGIVRAVNTDVPEDRTEARELVLPISTFQPAHEGTSTMNVSDQSCDNFGHFEQLPVLEEVTEPTPKEHRKPTYGKGLNKLTKSMGHKLQPTFVEGKKRPEQPLQAAKLASESGIVVRDHMPIYTHWKLYNNDARDHGKDHRSYLANRLEIDVDDPTTRDVCSDLLKSGVRQQRYRLKRKYFSGVPENEVLSNKPPGVSQVDWVKLVKKWSTPRDQETSKRNKQNRKEVRLHQTTGSRSYIAQRFSMKVNGEEADSIDLFKSSHYSKNKGYSDLAQEAIDAMETARDQAVDEGEESKSTNEIVSNILSEFSKSSTFLVNMGIKSCGSSQKSTTSSVARIRDLETTVEEQRLQCEIASRNEVEMRATIGSQQEEIDRLKKQVEEGKEANKKNEEQMSVLNSKQQRTDELLLRLISQSTIGSGSPNSQ
ncbi:hypothetical protein BS78_05G210700 [Paspalum vaginatum]|nr:hypothetical protein BS78_05G210700 [Paspalum vaginatum]